MAKDIVIEEISTRKFPVPWKYEKKIDDDTGEEYFLIFAKGHRLVATTKFEHGAKRIIQIVHMLAEYEAPN